MHCADRTKASLVEGGGFEPPKAMPADLQSAPFGRSGTPPILSLSPRAGRDGAGGGTRTRDLLLTRQLLYRLSYASPILCTKEENRSHPKTDHGSPPTYDE